MAFSGQRKLRWHSQKYKENLRTRSRYLALTLLTHSTTCVCGPEVSENLFKSSSWENLQSSLVYAIFILKNTNNTFQNFSIQTIFLMLDYKKLERIPHPDQFPFEFFDENFRNRPFTATDQYNNSSLNYQTCFQVSLSELFLEIPKVLTFKKNILFLTPSHRTCSTWFSSGEANKKGSWSTLGKTFWSGLNVKTLELYF